jgi:hypothetical protein
MTTTAEQEWEFVNKVSKLNNRSKKVHNMTNLSNDWDKCDQLNFFSEEEIFDLGIYFFSKKSSF